MPVLVLLLMWFCGSRTARFVHARTGSRPLAAVGFFFGCTIPWADAWIGVPYFHYWQRNHPAGVVYRTEQVEGYLREDELGGSGFTVLPKPGAPYAYVETPHGLTGLRAGAADGNYVAVSVVNAPNEECVESTEDVVGLLRNAAWPMDNNEHCLKLVPRNESISRYSLTMEAFSDQPEMWTIFERGPWRRVNAGFFRIYGRQHKIVDRETGEILAEAWTGRYLPWLSTLTGGPIFRQRARSLAPLPAEHPVGILIPKSPGAGGER